MIFDLWVIFYLAAGSSQEELNSEPPRAGNTGKRGFELEA